MTTSRDEKLRWLRPILSMSCFRLLFLVVAILGITPAPLHAVEIPSDASQRPERLVEVTTDQQGQEWTRAHLEDPPLTFQITLAELGYEEKTLSSPFDTAEYTIRLPEGWELRERSFFELDISYMYQSLDTSETQSLPALFGDVLVTIDGENQPFSSISKSELEHARSRVYLPLSLFGDPDRRVHSIKVALDASYICEIPHRARLVIHPTSFFSLDYSQLPIVPDLARYPRPFYQEAFESDGVYFVLPARPAEPELAGALAVAAKLGDLAPGIGISGTTDLELAKHVETLDASATLHEHLIVVGRPESNEMILRLNQLGVLPVSWQERRMSLASGGPDIVAPGGILTFTVTLTNTTSTDFSSLSLVDTLPVDTQVVRCSPLCSESVERQVSWPISALEAGQAFSGTLELRLSETITNSVIENTVTLLDEASEPLNVDTVTTIVRSPPFPELGLESGAVDNSRYFFVTGGRAVPENDGIVQEIVSPWDQTRAILVITGLSDAAVYKAAQGMSFESHFPGMEGQYALVQEVHPQPHFAPEPKGISLTFADLGYGDWLLDEFSQEARYDFYVPFGWRLTEGAYLDLDFTYSQLLDYDDSYLNVLFNGEPVASIALSSETALRGELKAELPVSQARPGQYNSVSIQVRMRRSNECSRADIWTLVSSLSLLHVEHEELDDAHLVDLSLYPHPFNQRLDLTDVLFVLPPDPQLEEWVAALRLAGSLGEAVAGVNLAPAVALGDTRTEEELAGYHLIAIGRPLRNLAIQHANTQLPQPFRAGSDQIEQWIDDVVFRLPPDLSLGFVQLVPSPWNEARVLVAVTGTTDKGVQWAADALSNRPWDLSGNLVLIRDKELDSLDTRTLTRGGLAVAVSTSVPEMTPVATSEILATATPLLTLSPTPKAANVAQYSGEVGGPAWLLPLIAGTGVVIIAILAIAFWQARRRPSTRL